jgi:hypothetical protein
MVREAAEQMLYQSGFPGFYRDTPEGDSPRMSDDIAYALLDKKTCE